jgi:hypothetical protein
MARGRSKKRRTTSPSAGGAAPQRWWVLTDEATLPPATRLLLAKLRELVTGVETLDITHCANEFCVPNFPVR